MTRAESALGRTIFVGVKEICVNCLLEITSVDIDGVNTQWVHTKTDSTSCTNPIIANLSWALLP